MSPAAIAMQEAKVSTLARNGSLDPEAYWLGLGKPSFSLSRSAVKEAVDKGEIEIASDGNVAKLSESFVNAERQKRRSQAAQKAAVTRHKQPPSPCALRFMRKVAYMGDWTEPQTWSEKDGAKELLRKGFAIEGTFNAPSGRVKKYWLTTKCDQYLSSEGQA